jgi:hypothetical protein
MTGLHSISPKIFRALDETAPRACVQASRYRVQYHGLELGSSIAHFIAGTAGKGSSFPVRLLLTIRPGW